MKAPKKSQHNGGKLKESLMILVVKGSLFLMFLFGCFGGGVVWVRRALLVLAQQQCRAKAEV